MIRVDSRLPDLVTADRGRYGGLLARLVKSSGMTTTEIAAELGVNQSTISQYTTGRTVPPLQKFERLVNVCGYELVLQSKVAP